MSAAVYTVNDLVRDLQELRTLPAVEAAEFELWVQTAENIKDRILKAPGLSDRVPHGVWHYLDDVDIRRKDLKYARYQEGLLDSALKALVAHH